MAPDEEGAAFSSHSTLRRLVTAEQHRSLIFTFMIIQPGFLRPKPIRVNHGRGRARGNVIYSQQLEKSGRHISL